MVHAQTGDLLEEAKHFLALPPAVDHHRDGTEVHAIGRHEEKVRAHPVEFRQEHPHPDGPLGYVAVDTEKLLGGEREDEFVVERTEVVHPRHVGAALHEGQLLGGLLHTGMQIPDDRLAPENRLTLELKHESEHSVGRRVLGTHVDDHRLVVLGIVGEVAERGSLRLAHPENGADLAEELASAQLGPGTHLLRALVGDHGHDGAPLN